jgi:predicted TPR repeat methyltransferase
LTRTSLRLRKALGGLAVGQDGCVSETWDSVADWYAERLAAGSAPHQLAIAAVLQLLPAVTDQPVLDLGCGEGLAGRALAARGAQVIGVDLSEQMIGHARRQEAASPLVSTFGSATPRPWTAWRTAPSPAWSPTCR